MVMYKRFIAIIIIAVTFFFSINYVFAEEGNITEGDISNITQTDNQDDADKETAQNTDTTVNETSTEVPAVSDNEQVNSNETSTDSNETTVTPAVSSEVETNETTDENATSAESSEGQSRWKTTQPQKLTTSDGIIVEYNFDDLVYNYEYTGIKVLITIPANYSSDEIVLAPDVFGQIAIVIKDNPEMYVEPGDEFVFDISINNLSKYTYDYVEDSFVVMPKENIVYTKLVNQEKTGGNNEAYNGLTLNENYHFFRYYNTALKELLPNANYRRITDDVINEALINKGYENGIDDYGQYLLDFYNNKYNTNYTNLDNFPDGVIREMLYNVDPYVTNNTALASLGINYFVSASSVPTQAEVLNDINKKQSDKVYTSLEEFYLDYYNNKYGTNATKFVDLSDDALDEFYSMTGYQNNASIIESNNSVDVLSYNYFYNKGLAYGFDYEYQNEIIKNNGKENEDYSIGEYTRNRELGNKGVKANAATLAPNSTSVLPNNFILLSGEYLVNSFQIYEFNVDLQFAYNVRKGKIIVNYIDIDTLEKLDPEYTEIGKIGDDYTTEQKSFTDYKFVKVDGEPQGPYAVEDTYITYYYKKYQSISVKKVWEDNNNILNDRPATINVHVLANDKEIQSITLSERNNWTAIIDDLEVYSDGKKIEYTVTEDNIDLYTSAVSGDATNGFVITNTRINETTEIIVTKVWDDKDNYNNKRPETVMIVLLANGEEVNSTLLSESNNWTYTFENLNVYEGADEIEYTIKEVEVENYYTEVEGNAKDGFTITNTYFGEGGNDEPVPEPEPTPSDNPKTADNIMNYILMLMISIFGLIKLSYTYIKNN